MAKTLEEHYGYLADSIKIERYRDAITRVVRPGDVVVDLGCGSGLLGLLALEAGAGQVVFIEEGEIMEIARKSVTDAGYADASLFLHANSFEVDLAQKADVVVCDHVGYFGFDYGILALLADARERFLKPGGVLLPARIELRLAPVSSENCFQLVDQWRNGSVPSEFAWVAATSANTKHALELTADNLLASEASLGSIELGEEAESFLAFDASFECRKEGMLHGVAGWFDCELVEGVSMTNSPTADDHLQRPQAVLPIETPLELCKGDIVNVKIMARPLDYVIAWVVEIPSTGDVFSHTTFNSLLLDKVTLSNAQPDRVAALNDRGRATEIVLSYCDGNRTIAEVLERVLKDHPNLLPSKKATEWLVQQLLARNTSE